MSNPSAVKIWAEGTDMQMRMFVREQDRRFQAAMRSSLQMPPAPKPERKRSVPKPRVRDIIAIASFVALPDATAWQRIVADVCLKYEVTKQELTGEGRAPKTVHARQEAMYRMRKETTMSTPAIARRLGRADHTTVLYGIRKHAERMAAQ